MAGAVAATSRVLERLHGARMPGNVLGIGAMVTGHDSAALARPLDIEGIRDGVEYGRRRMMG